MTTRFDDVVDDALARLLAGESSSEVLADYPAESNALYPILNTADLLKAIEPVAMPTPVDLLADRNGFLAAVDALPPAVAVPGLATRLKGAIVHRFAWHIPAGLYFGKEANPMSALLAKAVIVLALFFGVAGGSVAMAAGSLPGSPVYPLKLAMEEAQLTLASGASEQASLQLERAQIRVQEMMTLAAAGDSPDEALLKRLQTHLAAALQTTANAPFEDVPGLLAQTRAAVQAMQQQVAQAEDEAAEPVKAMLRQASMQFKYVEQASNAGLQDPQTFQYQFACGHAEADCDPEGFVNRHQYQQQQQTGPATGCADDANCQQTQQQTQTQVQNHEGCADGVDCAPTREQTRQQTHDQLHFNGGCQNGAGDCDAVDPEPVPEPDADQEPVADDSPSPDPAPAPDPNPDPNPPSTADPNPDPSPNPDPAPNSNPNQDPGQAGNGNQIQDGTNGSNGGAFSGSNFTGSGSTGNDSSGGGSGGGNGGSGGGGKSGGGNGGK